MNLSSLLATVLLATLASAASSLPAGTYSGTGYWMGKGGMKGEYTVETTVEGQLLTSRYTYSRDGGNRTETHALKMALAGEPFFDVLDVSDHRVGSGFCYESQCSYRAELGPLVIEETLTFGNGTLEKLGAKKGADFSVVWKEVLERR